MLEMELIGKESRKAKFSVPEPRPHWPQTGSPLGCGSGQGYIHGETPGGIGPSTGGCGGPSGSSGRVPDGMAASGVGGDSTQSARSENACAIEQRVIRCTSLLGLPKGAKSGAMDVKSPFAYRAFISASGERSTAWLQSDAAIPETVAVAIDVPVRRRVYEPLGSWRTASNPKAA